MSCRTRVCNVSIKGQVQLLLPSLEKISLHQQTPTYTERVPVPLPQNTRALVVSVFCNFWNTNGHAYLNALVGQQGSGAAGAAEVPNTHYAVYANTFYYEVTVPWDARLDQALVVNVTSSYTTGGDKNWYRVRVVGYITA